MGQTFKIAETKVRITADNDAVAQEVRQYLKDHGVVLINLMASPGAGKTTTLVRTINALKDEFRIGVMEADMDSDVDARTISELGVRVIQLHTGGSCHMDADMTMRGLQEMGIDDLDVVILENVGNLVCPAEFDVGADFRVMILSVPEGDDKPLKYPLMFTVSDVMLINKIDTAPIFDFDFAAAEERAKALNPKIAVMKISSKTGEGYDTWIPWLKQKIQEVRNESH
ncbi:MAG: hydrogenase nickel incorporation protein HypB [Solobacterium sp.]|nr:hydrogenase nickel incorporation protein HypB [Solobacterium sp.]